VAPPRARAARERACAVGSPSPGCEPGPCRAPPPGAAAVALTDPAATRAGCPALSRAPPAALQGMLAYAPLSLPACGRTQAAVADARPERLGDALQGADDAAAGAPSNGVGAAGLHAHAAGRGRR